ncbi:ATP-binding protein [Candidatus Parcubacteria bacterium]|nr:ATP-binding protein [Patescibacteria group bacterium]MBU4380668.1 ATP-binding protein [Patescibacteria group bacterium]MCG2689585.1 ATP-binding protein [Candidatus Parcubacteria bacterium]
MIKRQIILPQNTSFFLFGPRGTGKSYLIKERYPKSVYIDLLESDTYRQLLAKPERLREYATLNKNLPVVIDEIQRVPNLLNEVHRLIENEKINFVLTGSSARKLKETQANLLAGRALKYNLFPLTLSEIGKDVSLDRILKDGLLPTIYDPNKNIDPAKYLESYVQIYLEEEVLQEGLTRNLANFSRFLEIASFSQGQQLNVSEVARESSINRKVAESYFRILYDLLIAYELPVFKKRVKRKLVSQSKFYYFDVGVYSTIKPKGFLDRRENGEGILYESLVLQEIVATNSYLGSKYEISYWRTKSGVEVDFVLYGEDKLIAIEVKRKDNILKSDITGLLTFKTDYPMVKSFVFYGGDKILNINGVIAIPIKEALLNLTEIFQGSYPG